MLCSRCQTLRFEANPFCDRDDLDLLCYFPLLCILHETRGSFLDSTAKACHLCCLIRAQLGTLEFPSPECDVIGAFVALLTDHPFSDFRQRRAGAGLGRRGVPLTVSIISRLGNGSLVEVPTDMPGQIR